MLTKIVVALDGSKYSWSAAKHAIQLARLCKATLYGVSVTDVKIIEGKLIDELNIDAATAQTLYQDQGRLYLEQLELECKAAGVTYHAVLTAGVVPGVICSTAAGLKAELIVLGKRGVNAKWASPLLGATTETVVRLAKRPVLLAQETYTPIESIYVAYDGELMSVRALRFAADLCSRKYCKWRLCVLSVHRSPERRKKLLNEAAKVAELHGVEITPLDRNGEVVERILELTSDEPNALIMLGARSRKLLGLTLGNVPERLMRRARQPILLYRPLPA